MGLKIVAVAEEDCDYEAKVEIFNINFCSFKQILVVLRHILYRGVDNGAAGAATGGDRRPNNLASLCYTEMTDFSPLQTIFCACMNAI